MSQKEVFDLLMSVYPKGLTYQELMDRTGLSYGSIGANLTGLRKWREVRTEQIPNLNGEKGEIAVIYAIPPTLKLIPKRIPLGGTRDE